MTRESKSSGCKNRTADGSCAKCGKTCPTSNSPSNKVQVTTSASQVSPPNGDDPKK